MTFHKYFSPDSFNYIFVEDGVNVRFSQPEILNDIFDSNLASVGLNENSITTRIELLKKNKLGEAQIEKEIKKILKTDPKEHHTAINRQTNYFHGILSLTEVDENDEKEDKKSRLMWSHYAVNHTGFMISFKSLEEIELFNNPEINFVFEKVIYSKVREEFQTQKISDNKNCPQYLYTKDNAWVYENEFRVIAITDMQRQSKKTDERGYPLFTRTLNSSAVEKVVIGARADEALVRKIIFWALKQHPRIPVFKAEPSIVNFKLDYKKLKI